MLKLKRSFYSPPAAISGRSVYRAMFVMTGLVWRVSGQLRCAPPAAQPAQQVIGTEWKIDRLEIFHRKLSDTIITFPCVEF